MAIDFSAVGAALAAPARSAMLSALMDGSSRPASELAAAAGVRPSTASEHLAVLVGSGLLEVAAHGRHRYYRIADDGVADALERLGRLCPVTPVRSYRQSREAAALEHARLCYDHLAGRLGVAVAESMTDRGWLDLRTPTLTDAGHAALSERGLDVAGLTGRRPLVRSCLDWTQRRPHLAGALGAAVATRALEAGWVTRRPGSRALRLTPAGRDGFADVWGVPAEVLG